MKSKAWSSPRRGKRPVSLFSGYLQFYCLTNARGSLPWCREPAHTEEPRTQLRMAAEAPDGVCRSRGGNAPGSEAVPVLGGPLPLAHRWPSGGLGSVPRPRSIRVARGTSGGLWEPLDLTSDLGKALTRRKDTASSRVGPRCPPPFPAPSASRRGQGGGRRPDGLGRAPSHGFYCQYNFAQEFFESDVLNTNIFNAQL